MSANPLHDLRYGPGVIPDHNSEGFDSVDSEDFDQPPYIPAPLQVLPDTKPLSAYEQEQLRYWFTSEAEKEGGEDEFLKQHGVI